MANDFSGDANLQSLYTIEDYLGGADGLDDTSGKGNNLGKTGSPELEETLVKEGVKAVESVDTSSAFVIADASLSANFPGKNGTSNNVFSLCFWARPTAIATYNYVVTKWNSITSQRSFAVILDDSGANPYWSLYIGYNGGASSEAFKLTGCAVGVNKWYHVAMTYDGATKAWHIRVWDEDASTVYDGSGTGAQTLNIEAVLFAVMGRGDSGGYFTGVMDEVVIFNDILTSDEIDEIRNQTFGGGGGGGGDGAIMFGSDF